MSKRNVTLPVPLADLRRERTWPEGIPIPKAGPYRAHQTWTCDEENAVRANYPRYGAIYLARLLGRTQQAIKMRASLLAVSDRSPLAGVPHPLWRRGWAPPSWSDDEEVRLRALHAERHTVREMAAMLKRTQTDVAERLRELGLRRAQRPWTDKEDRSLRKNYDHMTYAQIGALLGRSATAVKGRAVNLGIVQRRTWRPWTAGDDKRLRALYHSMPAATVANRLERSLSAVLRRAQIIGLAGDGNRPWTNDDDAVLRRLHRSSMRHSEIASQLKRAIPAIGARVSKLRLTETHSLNPPAWTKREDRILRKLIGVVTHREIGERLGRTTSAVDQRVRTLGLCEAPARAWTAREDRYVVRYYRRRTKAEIGQALERSIPAVTMRAVLLGVAPKAKRRI